MRRDRILELADAIERHAIERLGFNMASFHGRLHADQSGHGCGTSACIAGWTVALWAPETPMAISSGADIEHAAQAILDLSQQQTGDLFYPPMPWRRVYSITSSEAAAVLRHLAATGIVDWRRRA